MDAVKVLWTEVVEPSWQAYCCRSFDDKKAWSTGFIHGMSGVGKTRFNLEFLDSLAKYLAPDSSDDEPADNNVESLRAALKNSKTVVLDIRHNGYALDKDETKWPPEVILGLRLARQYWYPHVRYSWVRSAFRSQAKKDPTLYETFALGNVLAAIEEHKAAPTTADPTPRIPEVLHIAVDEIQTAFYEIVPYRGGVGRQSESAEALEPLSTALNRALQGAISQSRKLFVIGTLSGTAARHATEVLDPTDATTASVLLSPLSADSVRQLVASFRFGPRPGKPGTSSGQEWLDKGGKPFERLLDTTGGNARVLLCLEGVLQYEGSPSSGSLDLNMLSSKLIGRVKKSFNIESFGSKGSGLFGLLLALAGIPVTRGTVVSFEKPHQRPSVPISVADLERAGVLHLRPPPNSTWVTTWAAQRLLVMEVPFVLAQAALGVAVDHPEYTNLIDQALSLVADFYPDAGSFEKLALQHRVLRHNVASEWAHRQGRAYVTARELFCGAICHPSFTELRFVPAATMRRVSGARADGVWWKADRKQKMPPSSIDLLDGREVDLSQHTPYAILLSGSNAVDGVLNETFSHEPNKNVRIYIDAKHTKIGALTTDDPISYSDDVKPQIIKRLYMAEQFPEEEHIMVITTNKRAQRQAGAPHTAVTLLRIPDAAGGAANEAHVDPRTCLITSTDDSLAWAMGPTFARFLVRPSGTVPVVEPS